MKLSFLFWNIGQGRNEALFRSISRFAGQEIDVFLFAEAGDVAENLLAALNQASTGPYSQIPAESTRVLFFSRVPSARWIDRTIDPAAGRFVAYEIQPEGVMSLLLVGAHLVPANYLTPDDRAELARDIAKDIQLLERDVGHSRTILVGDLNMNPFDGGLIQTTALHAVMTEELAVSVQQLESREDYPPFYNPMWSCLGDRDGHSPNPPFRRRRPPGTYFFANTRARANHFWHMYDQVLLRPALMHSLAHLQILDSDGEIDLVTSQGRPRQDSLSDHLPIHFVLDV